MDVCSYSVSRRHSADSACIRALAVTLSYNRTRRLSVRSPCIEIFIVALSQVSEGGDKCWYTSTLELQLASLLFCKICREVPTLVVNVVPRTPRSLWSSRTQPDPRHVPVVRARHLQWSLSMDLLVDSASRELWAYSKLLFLGGSASHATLERVVWPQALTELVIGTRVARSMTTVLWPPYLRRLTVEHWRYQSIVGIAWPVSLRYLSFGCSFNQRIDGIVWPVGLMELSFGNRFDRPIVGVVWPASLQHHWPGYGGATTLPHALRKGRLTLL